MANTLQHYSQCKLTVEVKAHLCAVMKLEGRGTKFNEGKTNTERGQGPCLVFCPGELNLTVYHLPYHKALQIFIR